MKSEKGWNPEKKKNKKEKRREVRKEESVGRKSMTKKKMTERTSPPQTLPRCYHWHSLRKKKKSNGASRTRKWPRQISTKKKGRGLTGNYLGWLRHSLHNIGCDSPKKKKLRSSILCGMPNTASSVLSLLKHCSEAHSSAERDAQVVHNYRRSIATRDLYNRDRFPFFHLFVFLFVSIIKLVKQFRNDPSHSLF